jgi:hypothetical protein
MLDSEDVFLRLSFLTEHLDLSPAHDSSQSNCLDITEWMILGWYLLAHQVPTNIVILKRRSGCVTVSSTFSITSYTYVHLNYNYPRP